MSKALTFAEKLVVEKNNFIPARSSDLPKGKVEEVLSEIAKKYSCDRDEAVAILAVLFQQGGAARSCDGNMTVIVFGKTVKLAEVRKILKQMNCGKAERKLARSLANEIFEICKVLGIPGNLSNQIQKSDLEASYTEEERVWMSDFQSNNEDCPKKLRTLILETFKKKGSSEKEKKKKR